MGEELLKSLITLTGLPEQSVHRELETLIEKAGYDKSQITLDEMREVLAEYLQDTLLNLKDTYEGQV